MKRDPSARVRGISKALVTPRTKVLHGPKASHQFEPFDDGEPMLEVFQRPNALDTMYDLWAYTMLFFLLTGTCRWWVMRDPCTRLVREIWPIPTHWTRPQPSYQGDPTNFFVQSPWGTSWTVPADEVVEFFEHSPLNRHEGTAVALACNEWFDAYDAGVRARLAQYKNGSIPSFHVALGESYGDPDDAMLRRIYSKWFERFQGENKTNLPLITGPDVEVKALGISPVDMAYVECENQYRDMILAAYGVNKALVGIEPSSDTSAYAPQRAFVRSHVNPVLKMFGERITEFILKPTPGYENAIYYWDDRAYDDPERKLSELNAQFDRGVITHNEYRAAMGHAPYEFGGDDPVVGGEEKPWVTGKKAEAPAAAEQPALEAPVEDKAIEEEPDMSTTEHRVDMVQDPKTGEWHGEIWAFPSGRLMRHTPTFVERRDAESWAARWTGRRAHLLLPNKAMGESGGTSGGYLVPELKRMRKKLKALKAAPVPQAFNIVLPSKLELSGVVPQTIVQNSVLPTPITVHNAVAPTPVTVRNALPPMQVTVTNDVAPTPVTVQQAKVIVRNEVTPTPINVHNDVAPAPVTVNNAPPPPPPKQKSVRRTRRVYKDGNGGWLIEDEENV